MHEVNAQRVPRIGHIATQHYTCVTRLLRVCYTFITPMPSLHTSLPVANAGQRRLTGDNRLASTGIGWHRLALTGIDWHRLGTNGYHGYHGYHG